MLDWVVVGGGVHGVTCASFLRESGVRGSKLAIVDPFPHLLSAWKMSTEAVGVEQLRSTHVHHVARDPYSLIRFAATKEGKRLGKLRGKYGHPDLRLFNIHSDRVIEQLELANSHVQDQVVGFENQDGVWTVELQKNSPLYGKNVVLAIGCDRSLPAWFRGDLVRDERIQVGFEAHALRLERDQNLLIVGSGMSGVQLAIRHAATHPGRVTLLSRRPPVKSLFDADPGWNGPKYLAGFRKIVSQKARRERITKARMPGSVPPQLFSSFRRLVREKSLCFMEGSLEGVCTGSNELSAIVHATDSDAVAELHFHQMVLTTGYSGDCPQRELLERIADHHNLPLAPCGFPQPRSLSHWGKGLHLSGALAELQVGPVARNIVGARIAGESLVR